MDFYTKALQSTYKCMGNNWSVLAGPCNKSPKQLLFDDFIATGGKFQFNGVFNGFSETEKPLKIPINYYLLDKK
jgi:hypothetical protein